MNMIYEGATWVMGDKGPDVILAFRNGEQTFDLLLENPSESVHVALVLMNDGIFPPVTA